MQKSDKTYDVVLVGSSFASMFFAHRFLEKHPTAELAVVEWGTDRPYDEQVKLRDPRTVDTSKIVRFSGDSHKTWLFSIGLGGTSNMWWGQTLRHLPDDFRMKTVFGVERDWPFSYDDLEPYYCQAEDLIKVSGPVSPLFPRSRPLPLPPHLGSRFDQAMERLHPGHYGIAPTGRPRESTQHRPACCNNGACGTCPIDSKFRVGNELKELFHHPRITILTGHRVMAVDLQGGTATGVICQTAAGDALIQGNMVFLGANAIFNPAILLRSQLNDRWCGVGITEQVGLHVDVLLTKETCYTGTTHITGVGFPPSNTEKNGRPRYVIENYNSPAVFNFQPGRLLNKARLKIVVESYLQDESRVSLDGDVVDVRHQQVAPSIAANLDAIKADFERFLAPVGVEAINYEPYFTPTEGHIECSTRMSAAPEDGVVDGGLVHHKVRNLLVGGASAFATCPPSNPSLTISAMSLRAADLI